MGLRKIFFYSCKWLGLFTLVRHLNRDSLRILCYHGFAFEDEHKFRPGLFITQEVFSRRLAYLYNNGYKVIDLDNAVERLKNNNLAPNSVVITIDDGFYSVYALALPLLKKYAFPSTLYLTGYYVKYPRPIFRIVMQYMFWKTKCKSADLSQFSTGLSDFSEIKGEKGFCNLWNLIEYGENQLNEEERNSLLESIAEKLQIDFRYIKEKRLFNLVNAHEIEIMQKHGMDIQLHTHRHRMPMDETKISYEIGKNREVLEPLVDSGRRHFCYPSGVWSKEHWPILTKLGIKTASTCMPGLNTSESHLLSLTRFLDNQCITDIEFEAEMLGFKDIIRFIRATIKAVLDSSAALMARYGKR